VNDDAEETESSAAKQKSVYNTLSLKENSCNSVVVAAFVLEFFI